MESTITFNLKETQTQRKGLRSEKSLLPMSELENNISDKLYFKNIKWAQQIRPMGLEMAKFLRVFSH